MTNSTQFLETEAALKDLTDELLMIKTATEHLDQAKISVQTLTQLTEQVISHATLVSKNSDKLLVNFGDTQEKLEANRQVSLQKMDEVKKGLDSIQLQLDEIANKTKKRDEEFSQQFNNLAKNSSTTRILGIFSLMASLAILCLNIYLIIRTIIIR